MSQKFLFRLWILFLVGPLSFAGDFTSSSGNHGSFFCGSLFQEGRPKASKAMPFNAYAVPSFDSFYASLEATNSKSFQDSEVFQQKLNRHNIQVPENQAFVFEVEKHVSQIVDFLQGHSSAEELPYQGLSFLNDLQESMKIVRHLSLKSQLDTRERSLLKHHRQSYHSFLKKIVVLQERIQKAKESGFRLYPVIHAAHYYLSLISMDRHSGAHGSFEYHIDLLNHKMGLFFDKAAGFAPRVIFTMKQLTEEDLLRVRFSGVTLIQVNRFYLEDDSGQAVPPSIYAEHDWDHGLAMVIKDQSQLKQIGWTHFQERSQFFDLRMKYFLNYLKTNIPKQSTFVTYWLFAVLHDEAQTLLDSQYLKFTRDVLEDQLSRSTDPQVSKGDAKLIMKQYDRWFENRWQRTLRQKFQDLKQKHFPEKSPDPEVLNTEEPNSSKQVGLTIYL